jgi:glycosyltransferase involved in cell wall biosynthesis
MRLVHYYPRALVGDGGPTLAMWEWASATESAGCDVAIIYDPDLKGKSVARNQAIRLLPLDHVRAGRFYVPRRLGQVLRRDDVLVLHSAYIPGNSAAAWVARQQGVPYIVMAHGGYAKRARQRRHRRKQVWLPVERAYLERALAVHLFFESETRDAAQVAPGARWIVAPTGFDLPADRWDGGTGGYLAWIGRYDIRTKGLDLLVQALTRLPGEDRRPVRLHGKRSEDGPEDIESLAQQSGVGDAVSVGGLVSGSDKAAFFRRAAAYVHPSRWESHSIAIVEALAYGIPSVISVYCSIAPKLRAADAAVIIEPTPDAIAAGISAILRNPQHYSDRARQFVRTNLAWPAIIDDYFNQIERLRRGQPTRFRDAVGTLR